jgi:CRP-like cAMP-binding protein
MNEPEPLGHDDEQSRDALDWLHADSRQLAGQEPEFDVERMLAAVRRRAESFWESLDLRQQNEFSEGARPREFAKGAQLMEEGEAADYVLVIVEGQVTISVRDSDSRDRVIAERGPGDLIGEHAMLRTGRRSATVVAKTQVRVLDMKAEDFDEFLRTHPTVRAPQPRPT